MTTSFTWPLVVPVVSPPPVPTFSVGQGAPRRAEELKRLVPPWVETRIGSIIGALLHGVGSSDQQVAVGDRTVFVAGVEGSGDILYTSIFEDQSVRIQHLLPTVSPAAEGVVVTGKDIVITLATDLNGNVLSTPLSVKASLAASVDASALIKVTIPYQGTTAVSRMRELVPFEYDGAAGARADLFLRTARGDDLAIIGRNYGVLRPFLLGFSDAQFRAFISELAFQPRTIRVRLENLLSIIFGAKDIAGWAVYEIRRKTITIELPVGLLPMGPAAATYLRSDASQFSTHEWTGDYLRGNVTQPAFQKVKPTSADPVSQVTNNSVYASASKLNSPALVSVVQLVKAAGVQVEFVSKRG